MSSTDGAGNRYEQFKMLGDELIRVTRIAHADWANGPTLRIQKVMGSGRLAPGPEFPESNAGELARALHDVRASIDGTGSR